MTEKRRDGATGVEAARSAGVLRISRPGTEWLHTGWQGGRRVADAAYNVSVPEGWHCEEIGPYVEDRLATADFTSPGPVLLTGVDLEHARGAHCGPVTAYATAGLSNPAVLPREPPGGELPDGRLVGDGNGDGPGSASEESEDGSGVGNESRDVTGAGTVNVLVVTDHALADGALANLVTVVAEAKAATLLATARVPGTTTDAVTVGHDPEGPTTAFSGSATRVGAAARACVREAVTASLHSRYADESIPGSVDEATYGVSTDVRAAVFRPDR